MPERTFCTILMPVLATNFIQVIYEADGAGSPQPLYKRPDLMRSPSRVLAYFAA